MGFVESLIALLLAGVACVALLSLGASVVRESLRTEMRDSMSQYADEALEDVKFMDIVDSGTVDCTHPGTYYFQENDLVLASTPQDLCSQVGPDGECEKLVFRQDGEEMFYREIDVECAGDSDKVTVRVGTLLQEYNLNETILVGYLPK